MDLEQQTKENTKAISELTTTVTRLATVVEITEKQRIEERQDVRKIVEELKSINDKMNGVSGLTEKFGMLNGEVGKLRHDMKNIEQSQQTILLLKEAQVKNEKDIINHETRINELEKWKNQTDGATGATKIIIHSIWAFISVGGLSFIAWIVMKFSGGSISGE